MKQNKSAVLSSIQNVAVFFNYGGETVALKMTAEQKRVIGLFAISAVEGAAELVRVPHLTLPADPEMEAL
ncbi:TPA: hypothetical protein MYQ30_000776 [Citrobacter freundii]|nr:hypothetical protein [Citrobacter freundii]